MNKLAQRYAIAKACGWTSCRARESTVSPDPWISGLNPNPAKIILVVPCDGSPPRPPNESDYGFDTLPDYLNDLNAMYEAEQTLTASQCLEYNPELQSVMADSAISTSPHFSGQNFKIATRFYFHATAAQRAEAFLKTIKLWTNE